jgi:hypothetical protein
MLHGAHEFLGQAAMRHNDEPDQISSPKSAILYTSRRQPGGARPA